MINLSRKRFSNLLVLALLFIYSFLAGCGGEEARSQTLQLNWFHDPTFSGEYLLGQQRGMRIKIKEGGPTVFPLDELREGRAEYAIVGIDIFIRDLDEQISKGKTADLSIVFIDFQRNPVGWIIHPKVADEFGLERSVQTDQQALNRWLFDRFAEKTIVPGDKRGTETTSVWVQWREFHNLSKSIKVEPVGFDSTVVLDAPKLAYPVYLNEEPMKLEDKIGEQVIIFDPSADGIELYGNVVVSKKDFIQSNREKIETFQSSLESAWRRVKSDPEFTSEIVGEVYNDISEKALRSQIEKTTEFVFFGGVEPGSIDVSPDGKLANTLRALRNAGLVSNNLQFEDLISQVEIDN